MGFSSIGRNTPYYTPVLAEARCSNMSLVVLYYLVLDVACDERTEKPEQVMQYIYGATVSRRLHFLFTRITI